MPADINLTPARRPLLPEHPGAWFVQRARVYLVVISCVVAGFFFVAGWMATPAEHSGLGGISVWQTVVAVAALLLAWFGGGWVDRRKVRGGTTGQRFH